MREILVKLYDLISRGEGIDSAKEDVAMLREAAATIEHQEAVIEGWKHFASEEEIDKRRVIEAAIKWAMMPAGVDSDELERELTEAIDNFLGMPPDVHMEATWEEQMKFINRETGYVFAEQEDVRDAGEENGDKDETVGS
jgi:hypothetical protein